ncbi:hypothetical protein, partial [Escherichia coli]|uniref:hypothetical protein n=1 Tax=Escherichia coli TaxID=562 RepID=UPI001952B14D
TLLSSIAIAMGSVYHLKLVFVDRRYPGIDAPYIGVDNFGGVARMVDYLVETGHRSFAYLLE